MAPPHRFTLCCGLALLLLAAWGVADAAPLSGGVVSATSDATRLARALVDPAHFDLLTTPPPLYTGNQKSGIIAWNNAIPTWQRHEVHDVFPSGAVVFSTGGNLGHTVHITGFNDAGAGSASGPDYVSPKISNSHDAKILDFTLRAKVDGYMRVHAEFLSMEFDTPARRNNDDVFHFEINDVHKAVLATNWLTTFSSVNNIEFGRVFSDGGPYNSSEFKGDAYIDTISTRIRKGDTYRFKIRVADRFDRLGDTAVYLGRNGIRVTELLPTCTSSSQCASGRTCCGSMCCRKSTSLICCDGVCCYSPDPTSEFGGLTCGVDAFMPTRKICCRTRVSYVKNGQAMCCPPGYGPVKSVCKPDIGTL